MIPTVDYPKNICETPHHRNLKTTGYNQKHPKTWDENMIYIQHSYNRVVHTSTGKSLLKLALDIFHLFPWMLYMEKEE
jgi:hypothetical protein